MTHQMARTCNMLLGAWLFLSSFLWLHTAPQHNNAWVVGLIAVIAAAIGFAVPAVRYVNTALAVWLFFSIWILPRANLATTWNSVIVGLIMLFVSFVGSSNTRARAFPQRPA